MRVTSKGQVTIPRDLRDLAGIEPGSEVVFGIEGGKVTVMPRHGGARQADRDRLDKFIAALDRLSGTGDPDLNADDVMSMTRDR